MFQHRSLRLYPLAPDFARSALPIALAGLALCLSLTASPSALFAQDDSLDGSMGPPPPRVTRITRPGAERAIADAMKRGQREGLEPVRLFFGTLAGLDRFSLDRAGIKRILKDVGMSSSDTASSLLKSFEKLSKSGSKVTFRATAGAVPMRDFSGRTLGRLGLSREGSLRVRKSGSRVTADKLSGISGGEGSSGRLYSISKLILDPRRDGSTKATATGHLLFFSKDVTFYLPKPKPVPEPVEESPEPPESVEASNDEGSDDPAEGPGIIEALEAWMSSN